MQYWQRFVLHWIERLFCMLREYWATGYRLLDMVTLSLYGGTRAVAGAWAASGLDKCRRPEKPLELYQFESCPYCRKVREALSVLAIEHVVYPTPKESLKAQGIYINSRFRPKVKAIGGKLSFPFIVDPNNKATGTIDPATHTPEGYRYMYESDNIIKYLWEQYGNEATPPRAYKIATNPLFQRYSLMIGTFLRPCLDQGLFRAASRNPQKVLEFWGYQGSPFCQRVQEVLSTLELPYLYHPMPHGYAAPRIAFAKEHDSELSAWRKGLGMIQVPYLRDPNTGVSMFESADIVAYLKKTYQTAPVPNETWLS